MLPSWTKTEKNEDDVWIDTIVIPKQANLITSLEDNGIEETDSINYLKG